MRRESIRAEQIVHTLSPIYERGEESLNLQVYVYHMIVLLWVKFDSDRQLYKQGQEAFYYQKYLEFEEIYEQRNSPYVGHLINQHVGVIFGEVDFGNIYIFDKDNILLKEMIEAIGTINWNFKELECGQVLSEVFQIIVEKMARDIGRGNKQEVIPLEIAQLIASLVDVKANEYVYDPCCGVGRLMIELGKTVEGGEVYLYGEEPHGMIKDLGFINLEFSGQRHYKIVKKDSISTLEEDKQKSDGQFDVAVCGMTFIKRRNWLDESIRWKIAINRLEWGMPPRSRAEYVYLSQMIHALKEKGRMAVVLTQSTLFRMTGEEKIREALIEENLIDTIIGLPTNLFHSTGIPMCIMILKKKREEQNVLFIDASSNYYCNRERIVNRLTEAGMEEILSMYKNRESVASVAYTATREEIRNNQYNLNIDRYISKQQDEKVEEKMELGQIKKLIAGLEQQKEDIEIQFEKCVRELLLDNL